MAEDDEVTFDMNAPPPTGPEGYIPLRFVTTPPDAYLVRQIAQRLLNTIGRREQSISFWQGAGELTVTWLDEAGKDRTSKASFQRLVDHMVQRRTFEAAEVDLPRQVSWLDQGVAISQPFQGPATNAPGALTIGVKANLGDDFPLTPWLDREGIAFSSVQLNLLEAIYAVRQGLVDRGSTFFNLDDTQWLRDLHSYLGLGITLVDATLMQIYYKAKYDALVAGLTFDRKRLGSTRNRRLFDKLQWVYATTGRPLDDAEHEIVSLRRLRAVRNHLPLRPASLRLHDRRRCRLVESHRRRGPTPLEDSGQATDTPLRASDSTSSRTPSRGSSERSPKTAARTTEARGLREFDLALGRDGYAADLLARQDMEKDLSEDRFFLQCSRAARRTVRLEALVSASITALWSRIERPESVFGWLPGERYPGADRERGGAKRSATSQPVFVTIRNQIRVVLGLEIRFGPKRVLVRERFNRCPVVVQHQSRVLELLNQIQNSGLVAFVSPVVAEMLLRAAVR